jgi:hypothetical protein
MKKKILFKFILLNVCVFLIILPFTVVAIEYNFVNCRLPRYITNTLGQYGISAAAGLQLPLKIHREPTHLTTSDHNSYLRSQVFPEMLEGNDWMTLEVTMPRNRSNNNLFLRLSDQFQHIFPTLRHLIGLY